MRVSIAIAAVFGLIVVGGACSLPSAAEFSSGTGNDPSATTTGDGSVVGDGSDGPVDGSATSDTSTTPLLDASETEDDLLKGSGGFEAGGNCSGHGSYQAVVTDDPLSRTGNLSCHLCREVGKTDSYNLDTDVLENPVVGAVYRASAWVRRVKDGAANETMIISLRVKNEDPFEQLQIHGSIPVDVTDDWAKLEVTLEIESPGEILDVLVIGVPAASNPGPACFLVDDLIVTRVK